ncbi:hypothetical protein TBLA_0B05920 [Henningerozyma blattae CBS 6284]|uniref:Uncharacterized protein n=1 Tax=Henningerozyma blattae (strain ATCC 34711 / CBS 6284 / DSM 70876 / NBRC 10599 / NRRL Y-10934 / UCD 77-7) TaxID=1071380 RepID=I2GZ66_HENB6|nr:hypothetical protein TBLA_0B05920 [Tetrapisispora blattae CBS 6284]CCH59418.1 hypothetical protein TBLA_0B05920 [Tetrapisispora blattae CBS 6284]
MSVIPINLTSFGSNNWCLKFKPLYNYGLLTSLSNGEISILDWKTNQIKDKIKIGETSINDFEIVNNNYNGGSLMVTATNESVKIYDLKSNDCIKTITNEKNSPFLSLDSLHNMMACGTELSGVDAELYIYDIRSWDTPIRSFVDSHHDDITDIKFHPNDSKVLMSGSTDGYTNIYDLTETEEEDSLHQVINYSSIHSCGWLSSRRIFTLSHMETFAIHQLNDKSEVLKEPKPIEFGDIRNDWGCNYVIDVYPGYIATGKTEESKGQLKISPFNNEKIDLAEDNNIIIPQAHGDEVIRDVFINPNDPSNMYSCGEDGNVKLWKIDTTTKSLKIPEHFFDYSLRLNVLDEINENDDDIEVDMGTENTEPGVSEGKHKKSHKKEKKSKKSKKKSSKHSKKARFKPY